MKNEIANENICYWYDINNLDDDDCVIDDEYYWRDDVICGIIRYDQWQREIDAKYIDDDRANANIRGKSGISSNNRNGK